MSLFMFLASFAIAAETASADVVDADVSITAAKEARAKVIDGYRAKLEAEKTDAEAKLAAANEACAQAKSVWLSMRGPIDTTNTELGLVPLSDVSPEIAAANAAYRKELEKLKVGYEAKIALALKDAKTSGAAITTANADIAKIEAELKRLDDQAATEAAEARLVKCQAYYAYSGRDLSCVESVGSLVDNLIGPRGSGFEPRVYSRSRVVYLPAEFAACFPGEVRPEKPEMMIGTKNNNL